MDLEVQDVFARKIERKYSLRKWAVGLFLAFVVAPLLTVAAASIFVAGVFALMCIVIVAAVIAAVVLYEPYIMKLRNLKLQMLKEEAEKNPIPTLLNNWEAEGQEIEAIAQEQVNKAACTQDIADNLAKNRANMSAEQIKRYEDDLVLMRDEDQQDLESILVLRSTHTQKRIEITRVESDWNMANSMKRRSEVDFMRARRNMIRQITDDAALAKIQHEYNVGVAGLRQRKAQRGVVQYGGIASATPAPQLANNPSQALPLNTVAASQYVQR